MMYFAYSGALKQRSPSIGALKMFGDNVAQNVFDLA
jgi:hypothetical protein